MNKALLTRQYNASVRNANAPGREGRENYGAFANSHKTIGRPDHSRDYGKWPDNVLHEEIYD